MYNEQFLVVLKGLPASGKTSYAKNIVDHSSQWKRVNKDDIRSKLGQVKEGLVVEEEDRQIIEYLSLGNHVIVDDTNLNPYHMKRFHKIAKDMEPRGRKVTVRVEDSFMSVDIEECIRRDQVREYPVGRQVIVDMAAKWITPQHRYPWLEKWEAEAVLPVAVIVDLDGTVALHQRNPYDTSRCDTDIPNVPVIATVNALFTTNTVSKVLFVSGREGSEIAKDKTIFWLEAHMGNIVNSGRSELHMREEGDTRSDDVVKKEIYDNNIKHWYRVLCVFDDRPRTRRGWLKEDLFVFSAYQHPEFKEF